MRGQLLVVATMLASATAGTAQERAMQTGTKTSDAGYAVAVDVSIPLDDMGKAGATFGAAFDDLTSMAEAEGFTLVGFSRVAMKSMGPTPDNRMLFQLQMPVMEQPTEEDLATDFGFEILQLHAQEVAYTYHKGSLDQVQAAFMGLIAWVQQNGRQLAGFPWMVVYPGSDGGEPSGCEIQAPVQWGRPELRSGGEQRGPE